MSNTPDSYHRTEDFEARIESVLLPDEAWAVFAQLEKPVTTAEVARSLGMDEATVQGHIDLLVQNKLARKRLMNWREFLAQKGISTGPTRMSPAGPQPSPGVLATQARRPAQPAAVPSQDSPRSSATPVVPPPPAASPAASPAGASRTIPPRRIAPRACEPEPIDPEGTITFRLANEGARRARRASLAMCITFRLGASAERPAVRTAPSAPPPPAPVVAPQPAPVVASEPVPVPEPEPVLVAACGSEATADSAPPCGSSFTPRRLRSLIDAITRKGGGGLKGQLLVYRVFLRVPPAIMFGAGIKSLNLVDDSLELRDERAYDAIRSAARSVASLDLDEVSVA
jgi:hypothetical protein